MINELKVSGAYLVKGFRKFSIWKGKRSPDITREHNLRIPPSQVRKLHSYCLKYCLNNSVSGKCFVTICYNQFWIMFFSNSPVILWLLLRHAPPHCQHKPLSWADCRPDSSGNLSPGYLDAPQLMGFKLLSACFSTKNPDETDCQWKQCHILPHVHYLQHWCFFPRKTHSVFWNRLE